MQPTPLWQVRGLKLELDRPLVMGIVNVTPDSFSDGGRFLSPDDAIAHADRMLALGADILDVGGESTRPQGAQHVEADEERHRVIPVIRAIVDAHPNAVVSVDTVKATVAEAAIAAGASIVNDVSGLRLDGAMAEVCASTQVGLIVMHSRGSVPEMATARHADYAGDALEVIERELGAQVEVALRAGIASACIAIDPGIGFSKRADVSLRLLGCLERLVEWGHPVVVGASRKRFIGDLTGVVPPDERVFGSIAAAVAAYERGARIFRVHDVAATRQALDVAAAIRVAGEAE